VEPGKCRCLGEQGQVRLTWQQTEGCGRLTETEAQAPWKYKYSTSRTDIIEISIGCLVEVEGLGGFRRKCDRLDVFLFPFSGRPAAADDYSRFLQEMAHHPSLRYCFPRVVLACGSVTVQSSGGDDVEMHEVQCVVTSRTGGLSLSGIIARFVRQDRRGTAIMLMGVGMTFLMRLQISVWEVLKEKDQCLPVLGPHDLTLSLFPAEDGGGFVRVKLGLINADGPTVADDYVLRDTVESFLAVPYLLGIPTDAVKEVMHDLIDFGFPETGATGDFPSVCAALSAQLEAWVSRQSLLEASGVRPYHWWILWQFCRQNLEHFRGCHVTDIRAYEADADFSEPGGAAALV
jgi:hypothetical protein